jgi:hypothetical protein
VIRCKAKLMRPVMRGKDTGWSFLRLPGDASSKLPSRGLVTVEGALAGHTFQATLQPDGDGGHWLRIDKALRERAGVAAGDTVALEIAPVADEPEPKVPADLRKALAADAAAKATWSDITPVARRDWIFWITSPKKAETRTRRVGTACSMLASGKRRACCFDRSGKYGGGMGVPEAATDER